MYLAKMDGVNLGKRPYNNLKLFQMDPKKDGKSNSLLPNPRQT